MKLYFILIILLFLNNCSFDNKSGIWKSDNIISNKERNIFKDFKKISISKDIFDKIVPYTNKDKLKILPSINNLKWQDIYFNEENNLKNFKFNNSNQLVFKSKKLTRNKVNNYLIFENGDLIISDEKGNIIVFSIKKNRVITKFNFYKKRYKGIKKKLNLSLENNIIYISDNIGYLYSFDYKSNKIIWATNYKLPLKSNLKISGNKIITADVNNNLIFLNKSTGEILKLIPTENITITNDFVSNLSQYKDSLFFLNSYCSLYLNDTESMNFKWSVNLNPSLNLNQSSLFNGSEVVNDGSRIIVSSNDNTFLIEAKTGTVLNEFNFSTIIKPIIHNSIGFFVTKNNLLIAINLKNFKVLYSQDITSQVAKFLNTKKKSLSYKNIMLLNDEIFIFLKNSFILNFNNNGELKEIKKLPSKLNTFPIIIDSSILFLNTRKKLIIVN